LQLIALELRQQVLSARRRTVKSGRVIPPDRRRKSYTLSAAMPPGVTPRKQHTLEGEPHQAVSRALNNFQTIGSIVGSFELKLSRAPLHLV
jgi:hypothetical protein